VQELWKGIVFEHLAHNYIVLKSEGKVSLLPAGMEVEASEKAGKGAKKKDCQMD